MFPIRGNTKFQLQVGENKGRFFSMDCPEFYSHGAHEPKLRIYLRKKKN
jgi:hypothetical protein